MKQTQDKTFEIIKLSYGNRYNKVFSTYIIRSKNRVSLEYDFGLAHDPATDEWLFSKTPAFGQKRLRKIISLKNVPEEYDHILNDLKKQYLKTDWDYPPFIRIR